MKLNGLTDLLKKSRAKRNENSSRKSLLGLNDFGQIGRGKFLKVSYEKQLIDEIRMVENIFVMVIDQ